MAENTILLFTDEHVKKGAKALDDAFDFKEIIKNKVAGALVEGVDGIAWKVSLNTLNRAVSPYVPDEYKDEVHAALDDVFDGDSDYTVAISNAFDILEQLKDRIKAPEWVLSTLSAVIALVEAGLNALLNKE